MRNVKIAFCHGWRKSRVITDKEPGYYNDFTVSLLTSVPDEVDNKKLIERWDEVCLTKIGELRCIFSYYELLDAETTAKEDYRVSEHNKGDWAKKREEYAKAKE